jgi:hypothetical protein
MDVPLSPLGEEEARAAAQFLQQYDLQHIACGPLWPWRGKDQVYEWIQAGSSGWKRCQVPDPDADPALLKLSSDCTLFDDDDLKVFAEKFRDSQDAFFESYAKAHKAL